jgi:sugar phosphate isomerase/epimerase
MNLALSNFAWDNKDSEEVFKVLKENNIHQIECILTKIKPWSELTREDIIEYKNYLDSFGITAYSIQSLFYGVDCKITDVDTVVAHFERLIEYAEILGSKILVFGSPGLRKQLDGWAYAVGDIFNQVDKLLEGKDIKVVIEPNAKVYNGEFWFTLNEIIEFLEFFQFNNIKTMIDTHNAELEGGIILSNSYNNDKWIKHIHASEVKLANINKSKTHESLNFILKTLNYNGTITYEVLNNEGVLDSIKTFTEIYNENNI